MPIDFLRHVRSESDRFVTVLRDANPAAPVPSCPDWTAADLLWHLTEVQLFWGVVARDRLDDPGPSEAAKPPRADDYDGLLAQFDTASAQLIAALEASPDDVPVWTWSDDHTMGFIRRRMAQEALIHRLDAELTVGAVTDLDPTLAADGVVEGFEIFYGGRTPAWATFAPTGPVGRLVMTDTRTDLLLQVGTLSGTHPGGTVYADEPSVLVLESGEPTFTVTATARDLDAWLWQRPTLEDVAIEGDRDDFARLQAVVNDAI
ncbi:MAG TPA: maleylpyruvate isomerase N-terminal domain-containing protein [Jatrophihabitans sp.]|jgi:uncharacterized protein (TIGR03083 family)|uniref:maleylpyruvate isomerase N-terminal domain-containing protein n=1 Tax=Jatrophihabitans sp. TaxID=1932789 RepID=UPI002E01824D|nr:maleylpyruvate isomerase N-terminal domain-containing protein [Jatrophihabitans sp.]